jgi:hypothetical protein
MSEFLINGDTHDTGAHHAERPRCAYRNIDNPAPHEWTTIIDPALN